MFPFQQGRGLQWCSDCGRYYDPKTPHECVDKEIRESQRTLEHWLGKFQVREEGQ